MDNNKGLNAADNFGDLNENLRIENEILKLKMQAQYDAKFGSSKHLPPELENEFLRNVQKFEEAYANRKIIVVKTFLGDPEFRKEEEMGDEEVSKELNVLNALLEEKNIHLDILGNYNDRTIYKFITEELFLHETDDDLIPGMTRTFVYEDFHPNHKLDIEDRTMEFLSDWFERKFSEYSWELSDQFILPDARILDKENVLERIKQVVAAYTNFDDCKYHLAEIGFEWNEEQNAGLGFSEGMVRYQAHLESGEIISQQGPFKLYLSNQYGFWSVFYFVFPGFTW